MKNKQEKIWYCSSKCCAVNIIFRNKNKIKNYIYEKVLILKFGKNCLIIYNGKQVEINKVILRYRCEFNKDDRYVQCTLNEKQAEALQNWQLKYMEREQAYKHDEKKAVIEAAKAIGEAYAKNQPVPIYKVNVW